MQTEEEGQHRKQIGWGSITLALSISWILLNRSQHGDPSLADQIVTALGGKAWSAGRGGFHYTLFHMIPVPLLAVAIGFRFPKDLGATLGRTIGILLSLLTVLSGLFAVFV